VKAGTASHRAACRSTVFEIDMSKATTDQRPIRAGVFSTVADAKRAVNDLLQAGFSPSQISVVCSDPKKEQLFHEFEHQEPAGTFAPEAAIAGGAAGAIIGSLGVLASAIATGGIALWAAGPIVVAGGAAGGLIGAMTSRGVEKELANYYQQAVLEGNILVAVDQQNADWNRLEQAAKILSKSGTRPVSLPEG
jgi:hypothetical protein